MCAEKLRLRQFVCLRQRDKTPKRLQPRATGAFAPLTSHFIFNRAQVSTLAAPRRSLLEFVFSVGNPNCRKVHTSLLPWPISGFP